MEHFSTLARINQRRRVSPETVHFACSFHRCHCEGNEGDEMENKFRKEMQSPLIQLKLKMIRDNVNRWDTLWASYEGRYKEMSEDEIKAFNAELHVIATDTMNELSSIRKRLIKVSVPFEEKPSEKSGPRHPGR